MEKEVKELLQRILANQVVIYKRLEKLEHQVKGGFRSAPIKTYVEELKKESEEVIKYINDLG